MKRCTLTAALLVALWDGSALAQTTTRVSVRSDGLQDQRDSLAPAISADGRFVAFESVSTQLVPRDTNGCSDVFLHDRANSTTVRISVASNGREGTRDSRAPSVSADGRFIAFESRAPELSDDAPNGGIFVHDRETGSTSLVSIDSVGRAADRPCSRPSISADGRSIAFESVAANLAPGDDNGQVDVFVHDRETCATTRVSLNWRGASARAASGSPSISADGRYVAFVSEGDTFVPNDTNGVQDVFVFDRETRTTTRVSVGANGRQADGPSFQPALSGEGRYVAFASDADDLVARDRGVRDVFVHDRDTGETQMVSVDSFGVHGNLASGAPSISVDGRWVAFHSLATNLVREDTNGVEDVFLYDRELFVTQRVSVSTGGGEANSLSYQPSISGDGSCVAFTSRAKNLVPGDTNGVWDVVVFDARPIDAPAVFLYADVDADGFGNASQRVVDSPPRAGYVTDASDCDDRDPLVHPGSDERYNGVDDDCDGEIDEGFVGRMCAGITDSLGCSASAECRGTASVAGASSLAIVVESVRNDSLGFLVWSTNPATLLEALAGPCLSWSGVRTRLVHSGGSASPAADCSGHVRFELPPDAPTRFGWNPGAIVQAQFIGRDRGGATSHCDLIVSNAVWFVIAP